MAKAIVRLAEPACTLLFAGSPHALIAPTIWRYSNTALVLGLTKRGLFRLNAAAAIQHFDNARFDPTCDRVFGMIEMDCMGRRILVLGRPAALGLLLSASDKSAMRAMRSVFADVGDARLAACHAMRMADRLGLIEADAA